MKRSLLLPLLTLLTLVATAGSARALPAPLNDDTIVVRLPNQATMTLYVKDRAQLRELRNYKLDSLMLLLDTYIAQAEKASKNAGSQQVTMEFYPAKDQPGKRVPEQIRITMHADQNPAPAANKGERVDVTVGRVFGVTVEESNADGRDRVSVRVGTSAKADSIRMAERKAKQEERENRAVHSNFTIDLGLNALTNKQPDQAGNPLDLRPWGSRYLSLNWFYNIRVGAKGSPLYLRIGPELAFNNYMLDNNYQFVNRKAANQPDVTVLQPAEVGRDLEKSKLAVSTINLPLMAALSFQDSKGRHSFRIGAGGFVGYRLGSHTKLKYEDNGNTKKDKDRGSYNLSDFQYGLQGTIGIRGIDLFAKYNLNELFKDNRGPQANTLSFGITLLN